MKLRHTETEGELFPELIDVLVEGWGGSYTWDTPSDRAFDVFLLSEGEFRDIWRRHKAALRQEARRRGLERPDCEDRYDINPPLHLREDAQR